jgi:hypothetical protein
MEEAYSKMADGVMTLSNNMESEAKKRARTNSFETGDGPSNLANPRKRRCGAYTFSRAGGGYGNSGTAAATAAAVAAVSLAQSGEWEYAGATYMSSGG